MDTPVSRDAEPLRSEVSEDKPPAWKQIEPGRFQPQRIKGSCIGRELG